MPIACQMKLRNLTQAEFDERDAVVMRRAYAAQNALGRLCEERVPVGLDGIELGSHAVNSHAEGLFFLVTAFTGELKYQHGHIQRLLALTRLLAVQWFNLNHTTVQSQTIQI